MGPSGIPEQETNVWIGELEGPGQKIPNVGQAKEHQRDAEQSIEDGYYLSNIRLRGDVTIP